jgi:hypothetical protein
MLRKTTLIALLTVSTISLSGCSTMWSGIGNFSEYIAEKTRWSSTPALRGTKNVTTTDSVETVTYQAATSDMVSSDYGVEMYDDTSSDMTYSDTYSSESYTSESYTGDTMTTSSNAPVFDADGNYIDTSPIPCPQDTYLTADNTCMYLEQEDYASEFTQ